MFDTISSVLLSTIIIIIFATVAHQFYGLGFLVRFRYSFPAQILITDLELSGSSSCFMALQLHSLRTVYR